MTINLVQHTKIHAVVQDMVALAIVRRCASREEEDFARTDEGDGRLALYHPDGRFGTYARYF